MTKDEKKEMEVNELIEVVVKAAMGESRVYLKNFSIEHNMEWWPNSYITVGLDGELTGEVVLRGQAATKAQRIFSLYSKRAGAEKDAKGLAKTVRKLVKENEKLKDRLSRLHLLSDPDCKDFGNGKA